MSERSSKSIVRQWNREIEDGMHTLLIEHGLELAISKDYVRQTQQRLLVAPLLALLRRRYEQGLAGYTYLDKE